MSLTIVCDGTVSLTVDGAATCSTGWATQVAAVPFDPSSIDPSIATALFGAGFMLCLVPVAAAWGIGILLQSIKRF